MALWWCSCGTPLGYHPKESYEIIESGFYHDECDRNDHEESVDMLLLAARPWTSIWWHCDGIDTIFHILTRVPSDMVTGPTGITILGLWMFTRPVLVPTHTDCRQSRTRGHQVGVYTQCGGDGTIHDQSLGGDHWYHHNDRVYFGLCGRQCRPGDRCARTYTVAHCRSLRVFLWGHWLVIAGWLRGRVYDGSYQSLSIALGLHVYVYDRDRQIVQ